MLRSQHRVYDGSGEVARTQDVWGAEGISGRVKFLPLAWAGMPKTSFRKNSDSPHSLQLASEKPISKVRQQFTLNFEKLHLKVNGWVKKLIVYRYLFLGSVVGVFILSVSLLVSGIVKFSAFPNVEGDLLQARVLMPVGSSLAQTQQTIDKITSSIQAVNNNYQKEYQTPLIQGMTVHYGMNADAFEGGAHLATVSVDLLTAEQREQSINQILPIYGAIILESYLKP
ncbi:hypothetical protein BMR02_04815 [Methylococcaceae bacterium HT1]|nr:hypothetical protein BMR02_04815 [Methylococcaceae bacterium HT1]